MSSLEAGSARRLSPGHEAKVFNQHRAVYRCLPSQAATISLIKKSSSELELELKTITFLSCAEI